eukprot:CAMPEP_0179010902 /NCGR_PEP_ID=MMETSP0796-20121207/381_1 /TAXON_ID=73915 /ORGANISM="Pyrodinium bahamense, Strain pbaha01" /LENGTH=159 /DNA_ID=CAMNT_0020706251 /DNA_START=203 /DNA_END=682 /DNA_ORIENTATION=-
MVREAKTVRLSKEIATVAEHEEGHNRWGIEARGSCSLTVVALRRLGPVDLEGERGQYSVRWWMSVKMLFGWWKAWATALRLDGEVRICRSPDPSYETMVRTEKNPLNGDSFLRMSDFAARNTRRQFFVLPTQTEGFMRLTWGMKMLRLDLCAEVGHIHV